MGIVFAYLNNMYFEESLKNTKTLKSNNKSEYVCQELLLGIFQSSPLSGGKKNWTTPQICLFGQPIRDLFAKKNKQSLETEGRNLDKH